MYEKVFQLDTRPFISTPDVSRFFSAAAIHDALSLACSAIERASGTTIVVGPTGSGKTLFLKMLEEQFSSVYKVVNLACARLTNRTELLQSILFELGQPYKGMSEGELRLGLIDYLKPGPHCPNGILLLVDEAQMLPAILLDEIRLLTSLVRDGQPRAQLVLAGGYQLEEVLMDPSLESFNQRIAARCYLENFSQAETFQFVRNAVVNAGGDPNQPIFTEKALHAIHKHTQGCPRQVNQVCDYAMILAATANSSTIDADCAHEAWADVQSLPNQWTCTKSKAQSSPTKSSASKPTPIATRPTLPAEQNSPIKSDQTIEFGELQDSTTGNATLNENLHEDLHEDLPNEISETGIDEQEENLRPLSSFTETELAQTPTNQDSELDESWTVIEFDSLLPEESEELNAASSYEDSNEQETVLEFGQLEEEVEYPAVKPDTKLSEPVEVAASAEPVGGDVEERSEYQLAPVEVNIEEIKELKRAEFETQDHFIETQPAAEQLNDRQIADDRFDDLARFLAAPDLPKPSTSLTSNVVAPSDEQRETFVEQQQPEEVPMASPITQPIESSIDSVNDYEDDLAQELQEESSNWQLDDQETDSEPTLGIVSADSDYNVGTVAEDLAEQTGWPEPIYDDEESNSMEENIPAAESHPDLFAETFDQEEVVYDPYAELFARQNKESLHITREQLNILDSMVAIEIESVKPSAELDEISNSEIPELEDAAPAAEQTDEEQLVALSTSDVEQTVEQQPVAPVSSDIETDSGGTIDQTFDQSTVPFQIDSNYEEIESSQSTADMKPAVDENELLRSIQMQQEEIASQIYKLKMDFSEADIEDTHVETTNVETVDSSRYTHEPVVTEYPLTPRQFADSDGDDDKDLLIIQRQDRIESPQPDEPDDIERVKKISKGRAVRMEYRELFNQLRAAE